MRWTRTQSSNYSLSEWTGGWTASTDASGTPIGGGAGFSHPIFNGQIGIAPTGTRDRCRPVPRRHFLWRTSGLDYSPPVITPKLAGTLGGNGRYVSKVSVTWEVADAESPIDSLTGCGPAQLQGRYGRPDLHLQGDVLRRHGDRLDGGQTRPHGAEHRLPVAGADVLAGPAGRTK